MDTLNNMAIYKCCVGGCDSTSINNRLYCMPMNDELRNMWMSFVAPTNPDLLTISKNQLMKKRVCDKHFDKSQFNQAGERIRHSYPCLLSEKEMLHGVPLSIKEHTVVNEHNYCSFDEKDLNSPKALVVMGKQGYTVDNEHDYCSLDLNKNIHLTETSVITSKEDNVLTELPANIEEAHSSKLGDKGISGKKKPVKNFKASTRRYIKECTSITTDHLGLSSKHRIESAQKYSENVTIMENFDKLSKKAKTFLLMQLRLARKNKMARRFSLEDKLLALMLMKQSPKGYKLLEHMFALPNKRTLSRLSEKVVFECGVNENIFHHLKISTRGWDMKKKLCSIVFDEVALTPNLTYNENKDKINGFVEIAGERKKIFADHALVFMIRGVLTPWRQTIAYYFCAGTVSSAELQKILKELIPRIIETGLKPLAIVCDQGSTFRSCVKIMKEDTIRLRNIQGINNYDGTIQIAGADLFCFFDPPHLLKGIRNNFLEKNIMWDNGKIATWKDIEYIYDLDSKSGHTRALPNLTAENINPKKIKKMKVKAAAQVLSSRTASMLHYTYEVHKRFNDCSATMKTTAEAVEFFDDLFDSVNGSPGGSAKGKLRCAIKKTTPHEEFWLSAIKKLKAIKFIDEKSKLAHTSGKPRHVRVPSLDGWITTLESFLGLTKLLFTEYGVDYFYPRYINQDPLENFFGRIRSLNYRNINPDVNAFVYAYKSLVMSNILNPHSKNANCEEDDGDSLLDVNHLFLTNEMNENKENILDENKENTLVVPSSSSTGPMEQSQKSTVFNAIDERVRVQISAYTAGYMCRKMTKKINCKMCEKTYISREIEGIHKYIQFREYKKLKNSNLSYPKEKMLILYRKSSELIHNYLSTKAHEKDIKKILRILIKRDNDMSWLGCSLHRKELESYFLALLIRLQVHHWCNIINKIMNGKTEEKYISKTDPIQIMAINKYKTHRLRKKKLNK